MRIAATQYSAETRSFEIYIAGCNAPHCIGCHNPALWDFEVGSDITVGFMQSLERKLEIFSNLIDSIWVLGGEPLDSYGELFLNFSYCLRNVTKTKSLWLFTRREIEEVPEELLRVFDFVKTGRYDASLTPGPEEYGVRLASKNQKVHSTREIYAKKLCA